MSKEWKEVVLGDVVYLIGGGTPKKSIEEYWGGAIPWLSVKDFNNDLRYVRESEESITVLGLEKSSTKILRDGQIIISARGTIGALSQVVEPMAFNQSCYGIDGKDGEVLNDFLYYLVKYSIDKLKLISHGAVFDTITKETFQHIIVNLPPLPEQKAIAHILGKLDDKIELNRQMNQTLEQMAQALFQSWFVDFDPVLDNAIMAGDPDCYLDRVPEALASKAENRRAVLARHGHTDRHSEEGTPEESHSITSPQGTPLILSNPLLASKFPSAFTFNETLNKWIPEGWEVKSLGDFTAVNSSSWTSKNKPEEVEYVDLANTKSGNIQETTNYTYAEAPSRAKRILNIDDTIFGTVRPGNRSYAFVSKEGLTGSTGFAVLTPNNKAYRTLINLFVTSDDIVDLLAHLADGGAYPAISPSVIGELEFYDFPLGLAEKFDQLIYPSFLKISENKQQTETLTQLRDVLLPQLISGKLKLSESGFSGLMDLQD